MTINDFLSYYSSIKPSLAEILSLDKELPAEAAEELSAQYELEILRNDHQKDMDILHLIKDTNISTLYFSSICFNPELKRFNEFLSFGEIIEKGMLLLSDENLIFFWDERLETHQLSEFGVTESTFIVFYCEYLQLYFNKIFRNEPVTSDRVKKLMRKFKVGFIYQYSLN